LARGNRWRRDRGCAVPLVKGSSPRLSIVVLVSAGGGRDNPTSMVTFSLQSGSNGNAIYVEAGDVRLLFDAGISGKTAAERMAERGRDIRQVDALLISHDHQDHVCCAGVYQRKFGLPIYMTRETRRAVWCDLGKLADVRFFKSGDTLTFGRVTVFTIRTPHDAADGVVFVVEFEGQRLAILTDLGHPFGELRGILESVDGAYLESNYDVEMLEDGWYPAWLKERIRGDGGHLSNTDAAGVMARVRRRPRWIAVAHLSADNNHPELALAEQRRVVGKGYPVHLAPRDMASGEFAL
jgi:phosphoribosyl 1,2-cyclic phosphodiesterase